MVTMTRRLSRTLCVALLASAGASTAFGMKLSPSPIEEVRKAADRKVAEQVRLFRHLKDQEVARTKAVADAKQTELGTAKEALTRLKGEAAKDGLGEQGKKAADKAVTEQEATVKVLEAEKKLLVEAAQAAAKQAGVTYEPAAKAAGDSSADAPKNPQASSTRCPITMSRLWSSVMPRTTIVRYGVLALAALGLGAYYFGFPALASYFAASTAAPAVVEAAPAVAQKTASGITRRNVMYPFTYLLDRMNATKAITAPDPVQQNTNVLTIE